MLNFFKKCCCFIKENVMTKENINKLINFIENNGKIPKKKEDPEVNAILKDLEVKSIDKFNEIKNKYLNIFNDYYKNKKDKWIIQYSNILNKINNNTDIDEEDSKWLIKNKDLEQNKQFPFNTDYYIELFNKFKIYIEKSFFKN